MRLYIVSGPRGCGVVGGIEVRATTEAALYRPEDISGKGRFKKRVRARNGSLLGELNCPNGFKSGFRGEHWRLVIVPYR